MLAPCSDKGIIQGYPKDLEEGSKVRRLTNNSGVVWIDGSLHIVDKIKENSFILIVFKLMYFIKLKLKTSQQSHMLRKCGIEYVTFIATFGHIFGSLLIKE